MLLSIYISRIQIYQIERGVYMSTVSILGDSISTYEGYNPDGYEVYYDEFMQARNRLTDVNDTWWAMTMHHFGWDLCVNNSYSGCKVSGKAFPAASSEARLLNLKTDDSQPDFILIYIGFNDFGYGVEIGKNHLFGTEDTESFSGAYKQMISRIKSLYPTSRVICGTLMRSRIKHNCDWRFPERFAGIPLEEYNHVIRNVCKKEHIFLADLSAIGQKYETLDGTHPTADGHRVIAEAWIDCIENLQIR